MIHAIIEFFLNKPFALRYPGSTKFNGKSRVRIDLGNFAWAGVIFSITGDIT